MLVNVIVVGKTEIDLFRCESLDEARKLRNSSEIIVRENDGTYYVGSPVHYDDLFEMGYVLVP